MNLDSPHREATVRRMVDANIVAFLIWDLNGRILEANEAFLRLAGYKREDLVSGGLGCAELIPGQCLGRNRQEIVAELQRLD
jgi:PAS domain S-box-containing protein